MKRYHSYHEEIRRALLPYRDPNRARFLTGYLNTNFSLYGLSVPQQRAVAKRGFSFFSRPQTEIDAIWKEITSETETFEVFSQALFYYEARPGLLDLARWKVLRSFVKRIDNWAHSDSLSSLYAQLLERYPNEVYAQYVKWNTSKHPWEVRASLVGLFYYARSRDHLPSFAQALRLVKGAFGHDDMYVQKGVGWCLREMYNVYPKQTYAFLKSRATDIAPAAWQASTEKLSKADKQALKQLRKPV